MHYRKIDEIWALNRSSDFELLFEVTANITKFEKNSNKFWVTEIFNFCYEQIHSEINESYNLSLSFLFLIRIVSQVVLDSNVNVRVRFRSSGVQTRQQKIISELIDFSNFCLGSGFQCRCEFHLNMD